MFVMPSSTSLVLVRHALPVVDRDSAPQDWPLSDQCRSDAQALARLLDLPADTHVVSSDEVKAKQTAEAFSNEIVIDRRLREVGRPWVEGDYESVARRWLEGERVDGWESRSDVVGRMTEAVEEAIARFGSGVCLVSHGLAISVLVAGLADVDPVEIWSQLRFPGYVAVDLSFSPARVELGGAE
ncbi:MAG TPA: histidine phosphatase family protein [Acidimicrobiia bacterium]|nr:histidine phosphatase family protein [Acidimicrobiia bacterium]